MGINIDLHVYDSCQLMEELKSKGAAGDDELLRKILEECGRFLGDSYVLLNNEYGDGYSPYYNVATLIDSAFGIEDSFRVFLDLSKRNGISYVDVHDVAERLGITLKEE